MVALRFTGGPYTPPAGGVVRLRFGATPGGGGDPGGGGSRVALVVALAAAWASTAVVGSFGAGAGAWGDAAGLAGAAQAWWEEAAPRGGSAAAAWAGAADRRVDTRAPWRGTSEVGSLARLPWNGTLALERLAALVWGASGERGVAIRTPWRPTRAFGTAPRLPWGMAAPAQAMAGGRFSVGRQARAETLAPWQGGQGLYASGAPWEIPPGPEPHHCYTPTAGGAVHLVLADPLAPLGRLLFACRHAATLRIPVREVYVIQNSTTLTRVADGVSIPAPGLSLSLDVDSWAWGFSASCPASALALLEPSAPGEPIELEAVINGFAVRVVVEAISRERSFGQQAIRVTGRGKTAGLGDPYQPVDVFSNASGARTSQQLVDAAMPAGWTVDWQLTPWLVPAGVWSHQGTPISAALAVAAAGGGYVQPVGTGDAIRVLPRYPLAPWDWAAATPDVELPAAAAMREAIEWTEKARYNRVYVSGTVAGVLGRVTRTGTAGDVLAPLVTDALITHADAARQRGLVVLADTGRQATVTLRLPVLPPAGVILPGKLVRYTDGATARVGLVRAVSLEVQWPTVWQTIRVETHVD